MNDERLNPWKSMWIQPRATVRQQVDRAPYAYVSMLAVLGGVAGFLSDFETQESWRYYVILSIVVAPLVGLFQLFVWGGLLAWTGKWLGARGRAEHLRTAIAWSYLPNVLILAVSVPLAVYHYGALISDSVGLPTGLFWLNDTLLSVLALWSFILSLVGVSEVQGFSKWKAFGNSLLALMVILIPIAVITGLIYLLVYGMGLMG